MTANPIELIGGLANTSDVVKADLIAWAKARVPQVMESAAEINSTNLAGQLIVMVNDLGTFYYLDPTDSTSADDPPDVIVSLDNKRFKPLSSVPAPTTTSLGGVYASAAVTNQFLTGVGADGHVTRRRPDAADLSDGLTGTGAVVRANSPALVTPTGIVKSDVGLGNVDNTSDTTKWAAAVALTNKTINAALNTITNLATSMFAVNVVDTDTTLAANSDIRLATQKAVKAYVDALLNANDAMQFRGVIDCSTNPNYPAANAGYVYRVSVAGKIGGASGVNVEAGDQLLCITDGTSAGTQAAVGANWSITQANIDGAVIGPASAVSGRIATFNGTTGKLIQDGGQALPSGTIVGTTDTQTLTNKTLTSPTVNAPTVTGGTHDAITSFGIRSTGAAFDIKMATAEVLTATRTLTWVLGDAARTLTLGGNATLNGGTHSGTNTGDQTITLTGDVTGTGTGSFATTIGPNKVTLGMMAQIATATFLGRTSASTGNVEALTAAQATALINTMVGDSGTGGTKGLVPAPGAGDAAAGKYLKADGTYAVPPGTGGGGALSDEDRQNILLGRANMSKALAGYQRFINAFADGYKASDGINAGASSNYSVNTTAGYIAPSLSAGSETSISPSGLSTITDIFNTRTSNAYDGTTSQNTVTAALSATSGFSIGRLGKDLGSGNAKIITGMSIYGASDGGYVNGATTVTIVLKASNTDPTTNSWSGTTIGSITPFTNSNATLNKTTLGNANSTAYRYVWAEVSGTNVAWIAEVVFYETPAGPPNNMTAVTTAQTADASVSNGRVLIEYDNTAAPTLNTDLTVEVTCNGGTNWTAATLSSVSVNGQGGRKIVETADTACTAGTSFAARIKTFNNKNIPIHKLSLSVH